MNSTQFFVLCIFAGLVTVSFLIQTFALLIISFRVKAMSRP